MSVWRGTGDGSGAGVDVGRANNVTRSGSLEERMLSNSLPFQL